MHTYGRLRRAAYIAAGSGALAVGVVGVFVPLLPTTPFVLLASACYMRGSERLNRRLLASRLGTFVRDYRAGGGIPRRAKLLAAGMIAISLAHGTTLLIG